MTEPKSSQAKRFKTAMKQILSVPKSELERREIAYKKARKTAKRRIK